MSGPTVRPAMRMTDAPFVPHNPKLLDFYALWRAKCRGDALPARSDFTVDDLRPFIGRIAILDVIDGGQDFRFRLYGTQIAEEYQGEMTGKSVGAFRGNFFTAIVPGYRRTVATRQPHYDVPEIDDDRMYYKWERLVVPLASDGKTIDMIMVCSLEQIYEPRQ
jgi:hypothetical protein